MVTTDFVFSIAFNESFGFIESQNGLSQKGL